jgi:N-acetylated-alpha-linked acidic dipeptidase
MDMVIYPGDPSTPFIGSTENAPRVDHNKAENLLKIPVLPISYHDAQPLLKDIAGPVAPKEWAGSLPITYHIGPSKSTVHLKMQFDWKIRPALDVIATIKGSEIPDEWVVRGNHHDGWVNGAADPISGMAAELEEAIAIGGLVKQGWRPKRTLVYCAWDGEEPGLLGSTEWAEDHDKELQQKAVAYINSDGNGRGFVGIEGSHALTNMITEITSTVIDPEKKISVLDRLKAQRAVNAKTPAAQREALNARLFPLGAMGSGSDYSTFIQHLGIPSLNIGYGGEDEGGEYHSIFDSYDMYVRFKDPTFQYGVTLAQTAGRAALRLADAEVLPFNFTSLHRTINGYIKELMGNVDQIREQVKVKNELIDKHAYTNAPDPTENLTTPTKQNDVPFLDFSTVLNALDRLQNATEKVEAKKATISGADLVTFNQKLHQAEQQLLSPNGLPRRPWFKHTIYAPGFYTGYGVKTVPGIREAIEQKDWKETAEQIVVVAGSLNKLAAYLESL